VGNELDIAQVKETGEDREDRVLFLGRETEDTKGLDNVVELGGIIHVFNLSATGGGEDRIVLGLGQVQFLCKRSVRWG